MTHEDHHPFDEEWISRQSMEVHKPCSAKITNSPSIAVLQHRGRTSRKAPEGLIVVNLEELEQMCRFAEDKTRQLGSYARFAINTGEPNGIGPSFVITAEDGDSKNVADVSTW